MTTSDNNSKRNWNINNALMWIIPSLTTLLIIVFGLWASTMKTEAVSQAVSQVKEIGATRYYDSGAGRELKVRVDQLEAQFKKIDEKQDRILEILMELQKVKR